MLSEWMADRITGHVIYRRAMRVRRVLITASVWRVAPSLTWEWMVTSDKIILTGWSRSLAGAKRNASRAMHRLKRDIEGRR